MAGRRGGRGQGSQQQQQSRDSNPRHRTNGDEGSSGRGRGHGRGDRGQSNGQSRTSNHDQNRNSPQDGGRGQSNGARRTKPPVDLTRHVLEKNLAANHGPPKAPKKMVDTQPEPRARSNSQVKHGPIPAGAAERWAQLTRNRDKERMDAIANGFLADPAQPRKLEDAITPVGTCEDMCPEFERVQRIVQNDVWRQEWERQTQALDYGKRTPDESRMVKKFRRAAAGLDEQLPSDLRPPRVLLKTTNYLLNELPTESSDDISKIQAFLWDRTRAIRNDFSIQQLKEVEDIRIAIDCYERIARFHIFSLHQMAAVDRKGAETYDWQQDREQLDRTLLTLLDYYGKVRLQYQSPNEVEFRVYDILLHIQSPQPYMEYKVQGLPDHIRLHPRILKAMELWEAATNSIDLQGPFLESVPHVVVQENWARFWKLIMSNQVSYLMACVAEVYFNLIRRTALQSIFRAFKLGGTQRTTAWVMPHVMDALGFDTEEEAHEYVAYFGLKFQTRDDGVLFLDISAMKGADLPSPSGGMVPQKHSKRWVEMKRRGRTFKAIVNGLSTKAARQAGWVEKAPTVSADSTMTESYEQSARTSTASTAPPSEPVAKLNPIAPPFALSASLAGAATFTGTPPTAPSLATGQANGFGQPSGFGQPPTIAPPSVLNRPSSFAPFTESSPPTSSASSSGFGQPFGTSQGPAFGKLSSAGNPTDTSEASVVKPSPHFSPSLTLGQPNRPGQPFSFISPSSDKSSTQPNRTLFGFPARSTDQKANTPPVETSTPRMDIKFPPAPSTTPFALPQSSGIGSFSLGKTAGPGLSSACSPSPAAVASAPPFNMESYESIPAPKVETLSSTPIPSSSLVGTGQSAFPAQTAVGAGKRRLEDAASPFTTPPPQPAPQVASETSAAFMPLATAETQSVKSQMSRPPQQMPPRPTTPEDPEKRKALSLDFLTKDLFLEPHNGILKQYIEYTASHVISQEIARKEQEDDLAKADEFRYWFLAGKFGYRWLEIWRNRRLVRKHRDLRKNAQEATLRARARRKAKAAAEAQAKLEGTVKKAGADVMRDFEAFKASKRAISESISFNGQPSVREASTLSGVSTRNDNRASVETLGSMSMDDLKVLIGPNAGPLVTNYFRYKTMGLKPDGIFFARQLLGMPQHSNTSPAKRTRKLFEDEILSSISPPDSKRVATEGSFSSSHSSSGQSIDQRIPVTTTSAKRSRSAFEDEPLPSTSPPDNKRLIRNGSLNSSHGSIKQSTAPGMPATVESNPFPHLAPSIERGHTRSESVRSNALKETLACADESQQALLSMSQRLDQDQESMRELYDLLRKRTRTKGRPSFSPETSALRTSILGSSNFAASRSRYSAVDTRPAFHGRVSKFVPRELYGKYTSRVDRRRQQEERRTEVQARGGLVGGSGTQNTNGVHEDGAQRGRFFDSESIISFEDDGDEEGYEYSSEDGGNDGSHQGHLQQAGASAEDAIEL